VTISIIEWTHEDQKYYRVIIKENGSAIRAWTEREVIVHLTEK
jgi:hypothetical protein